MRVLDLFSGIGGFSLGLEAAGFETVAFSEIEEFPISVLKKHWPQIPNLGDITKLTKENIYERVGNIDVICGGFPCQSVSIAGRKAGFEDRKKSGLWYEYKRLIEEIKPRWVIIENVRNLLNIGFAEVLQDLCNLGYDAEWEVISARSCGARHLRERIWIVAYPSSEQVVGVRQIWSERENTSEFVNDGEPRDARAMANSNLPRLWPTFATEEEAQRRWAEATACISAKWETRPSFRGVVDGLSPRMERHRRERVKSLGNSIVPQIAYLIGKRIMEVSK